MLLDTGWMASWREETAVITGVSHLALAKFYKNTCPAEHMTRPHHQGFWTGPVHVGVAQNLSFLGFTVNLPQLKPQPIRPWGRMSARVAAHSWAVSAQTLSLQ